MIGGSVSYDDTNRKWEYVRNRGIVSEYSFHEANALNILRIACNTSRRSTDNYDTSNWYFIDDGPGRYYYIQGILNEIINRVKNLNELDIIKQAAEEFGKASRIREKEDTRIESQTGTLQPKHNDYTTKLENIYALLDNLITSKRNVMEFKSGRGKKERLLFKNIKIKIPKKLSRAFTRFKRIKNRRTRRKVTRRNNKRR